MPGLELSQSFQTPVEGFQRKVWKKNNDNPIQINGIGARQHRISRGRAWKEGLWIPTTNTHLMHLIWKCETVLSLPEDKSVLEDLSSTSGIMNLMASLECCILCIDIKRAEPGSYFKPHCVWSFKGCSVPRRRQAGRADVEKAMPRSSYSHHNHNHSVLYANRFFVESVGCIYTHSGADMMIFYEFYVWLYDSCFEWAWSASAAIARPQLWRTGGVHTITKGHKEAFL